ncbi:hypothetical protein EJB05_08741, partial [Eragrostis curvula]
GTPEISQRKRTRPRRTSGSYRYHLDFPSPSRRRGDQLPHSSHRAPAPLAPKQAGTTKVASGSLKGESPTFLVSVATESGGEMVT